MTLDAGTVATPLSPLTILVEDGTVRAAWFSDHAEQLQRRLDPAARRAPALGGLDPALRKHRCTAMADLATALSQLKEISEGCRQASASLQLAIELRHSANADRIRRLHPQLAQWSGHPAVRHLDEQLRAVARW